MQNFMIDINDFGQEKACTYKGEEYLVRDNGAILRKTPKGKKTRPLDNQWTFGTKNVSNGYMTIGSHRVHIIVATTFHGERDSKVYVVDHIDTNRCNNRVENLRWLTRLENILLNEITRKKIEYICGSVENFLKDPTLLRGHEYEDRNFEWMRTVSKEEAENTLKNWNYLFLHPKEKSNAGITIGDWIYSKPAVPSKANIFAPDLKEIEYTHIDDKIGAIVSYNGFWGVVIELDAQKEPKLLMKLEFDTTYKSAEQWHDKVEPTWEHAMEIDSKFKENGWQIPTKEDLDTFAKVMHPIDQKLRKLGIENIIKTKSNDGIYETYYFMWSCNEAGNSAYLLYTAEKETKKNPKNLGNRHKYNGKVRAFCHVEELSQLKYVSAEEIKEYVTDIKTKEAEKEAERKRKHEEWLKELKSSWTLHEPHSELSPFSNIFPQAEEKIVQNVVPAVKVTLPTIEQVELGYKPSLTPNAYQDIAWRTPTEFPLCPKEGCDIEEYFGQLVKGAVFSKNQYGESLVSDAAIFEGSKIAVKCNMPGGFKSWSLAVVEIADGKYVHVSVSTYFNEDGADKYFTLIQGKEWSGGEVFDDYC